MGAIFSRDSGMTLNDVNAHCLYLVNGSGLVALSELAVFVGSVAAGRLITYLCWSEKDLAIFCLDLDVLRLVDQL